MKTLLIDNYDSFTFILYQYLRELGCNVRVFRNDTIDVPRMAAMRPERIVISPGPKAPADAGVSKDAIRELGRLFPILGVCLGHQCINEAFGGRTVRAPWPWHGKTSVIHHDGRTLFSGLSNPLRVARYHSLVVERESLDAELEITAWTEEGVVMGLRHREWPIEGVQFHPESFMTEQGHAMLRNFVRDAGRRYG